MYQASSQPSDKPNRDLKATLICVYIQIMHMFGDK